MKPPVGPSALGIAKCLSLAVGVWMAPQVGYAEDVDFARDVRPIFQAHCTKCHGAQKQQGGLRFDRRDGAVRKGDSGEAAIVPGDLTAGELLRRIVSTDSSIWMPPEGPRLKPEQIEIVRRWIAAGAVWPQSSSETTPVRTAAVVTEEDRQHWAYQPLHRFEPPTVKDGKWVRSPIDQFILASLVNAGLPPAPVATSRTMIRRMTYDLVGLPLTQAEVDAFVLTAEADAPAAIAALADRLLGSRHYGERWARHWLDVARYADSNGQESDNDRPLAYHYRDFVIRAFNDDLPFDTFVRWQLAGDEFEPDNPQSIAATGFLTAGVNTELNVPMEEEKIRNRYNELDDVVSTVGTGLLGLTLACTRCHDHKFDAIPSRDYYQLMSAFHSGDRNEVYLASRTEIAQYEERLAQWEARLKPAEMQFKEFVSERRKQTEADLRQPKIDALSINDEEKTLLREQFDSERGRAIAKRLEKALRVTDDEVRKAISDQDRQFWDERKNAVDRIQKERPAAPPKALAFRDYGPERKTTWLFGRGDFYDRDEPVDLGFVTVASRDRSPEEYLTQARKDANRTDSTLQRQALALWMTDVEHGAGMLVARVIVNRIWQHHFGEGLVRTPGDFGVRGEKPTHPELLEWLAEDFVRHGWRVKRLQRMILTSSAYALSGAISADAARVDPDNRLLWHKRPQRLEAEILRDAMLAISGTLNREPYGPAFKPPIPSEAMVARNTKDPYPQKVDDTPATRRRSIYMFHKRVVPYPLLQVFDRPELLTSCSHRDVTTVAPQALALMNDRFVRDRSWDFAGLLLKEHGKETAPLIRGAFETAFNRPPSENELTAATEFLQAQLTQRQAREPKPTTDEALRQSVADLCQVVFESNEFFFID